MDSLICSPVLIFVFASTSIAAIRHFCLNWACFLNWPSGSRSGESALSSRTWRGTRGDDPETHSLGKYPSFLLKIVFRTSQLIQQHLEICIVNVQVFHCSVHHAKISSMVLDLLHVPVSYSRNWVHKNSTSSGLVKAFLADLCTMRILSETFRRTSPTKPTVRGSLPQRVKCLIWNSGCNVNS